MTENPGRIRALLDDTLAGEPPLLDMVPAALVGARHGRRRSRALAGGAAVAVLAVAAGAYGMAGHHRAANAEPGGSAVGPASSGRNTPTPASPAMPRLSHKSDFGIPGLFDHPGTAQQQCAKIQAPPKKLSDARDFCARALTQIRALLPDDVVVLQPIVNFNQSSWSEPLAKTPEGGTPPGFVQAYQKAARNPATVTYDATTYAYRSDHGYGTVVYQTLLPGVKAKPQPGGDLPAGDGTSGHFERNAEGSAGAYGVTASGLWYSIVISGVYPVYGESGGWLSPTFKGDGKDHELYPDGYVEVEKNQSATRIPNPYSASDIRTLITTRGLASLVTAIGADPLSVVPADRIGVLT